MKRSFGLPSEILKVHGPIYSTYTRGLQRQIYVALPADPNVLDPACDAARAVTLLERATRKRFAMTRRSTCRRRGISSTGDAHEAI